jgi:soluble lytic murein transglycosylase
MKHFFVTCILVAGGISLLGAVSARADIYRYVDSNGVMHFTNTPTDPQYTFYLKESLKESTGQQGSNQSIEDIIERYALANRLEKALVKAVIKAESDYNPRALSSKGAQGMMQLIPETAREMKVVDPFDPEDNIRGGTRYLRKMLDLFNGNTDLAIAAYNAGPGAVRQHGGIPPYTETRNYVQRVKRFLQAYR